MHTTLVDLEKKTYAIDVLSIIMNISSSHYMLTSNLVSLAFIFIFILFLGGEDVVRESTWKS